MKVNFNPNYSNKSVNFGALKSISGREKLTEFAGKSGDAACNMIIRGMKENAAFDKLCQKFDVNVAITPLLRQLPNSTLLEKSLNLEVCAKKLRKNNFFGKLVEIFRKNPKPMTVAKYTAAAGVGAFVCASGSQLCKGIIGSFTPKPIKSRHAISS